MQAKERSKATYKDNDALRVEFVRSILNLPAGEEHDILAVNTLLSFIKGTAIVALRPADEHALKAYLGEAVRRRADPEAAVMDIATIARRAAAGDEPLIIPIPDDIGSMATAHGQSFRTRA